MHKDHLGSLDVITNSSGAIVQELSFDAWGQRRNAVNWTALSNTQLINFDHSRTTRGFTGHEMLDEVGIIHMNGRIYDPKLGRFLQADPFVQEPTNTQSLNRYSYVLNNPLNAMDPTGYNWLKTIFKVVVATVATIVTYGAASAWVAGWGTTWATAGTLSIAGNAMAGAMAGFIGGAVSTGTLKGAALGAFSGAVFGAIGAAKLGDGARIGAHAFAGGILSELQGGKFGHGFLSAGIMKGVGKISVDSTAKRTVIQALAGGTVSRITGGKFANGAATAALQYVVNETSAGWQAQAQAKASQIKYRDVAHGELNFGGNKTVKNMGVSVLADGDSAEGSVSANWGIIAGSIARDSNGVWALTVGRQISPNPVLSGSLGITANTAGDIGTAVNGNVGQLSVSAAVTANPPNIFYNITATAAAINDAIGEWFNSTMEGVWNP